MILVLSKQAQQLEKIYDKGTEERHFTKHQKQDLGRKVSPALASECADLPWPQFFFI
jgi:hypothetical protein